MNLTTYTGPVSNDADPRVQRRAQRDRRVRTGAYSKMLTFTLVDAPRSDGRGGLIRPGRRVIRTGARSAR